MNFIKMRQIEREVDLDFMSGMCEKVLTILSRESEIYQKPSVSLLFVKKELSVNYKFLTEVMKNLAHNKMITLYLKEGSDKNSYDSDDVMVSVSEIGLEAARRVLYRSAGLHVA